MHISPILISLTLLGSSVSASNINLFGRPHLDKRQQQQCPVYVKTVLVPVEGGCPTPSVSMSAATSGTPSMSMSASSKNSTSMMRPAPSGAGSAGSPEATAAQSPPAEGAPGGNMAFANGPPAKKPFTNSTMPGQGAPMNGTNGAGMNNITAAGENQATTTAPDGRLAGCADDDGTERDSQHSAEQPNSSNAVSQTSYT
ncbi:hypothetical protein K4F52_006530 [Lecanicillium sp. MT-2017a]|nr:hypothetical protein K4F52_006530 [Lecanicillium sp. MT-2017a]